jgi:hypothetical protein
MRQGRSNTRGRPPASPILPTNVAARAAALGCRLFAAKSLFVFFFLSLFAFLVLKLRVVLSPDSGAVALPFILLGVISVTLNTLADIVVAIGASRIREGAASQPAFIRRLREISGASMIALGAGLALAKRQ